MPIRSLRGVTRRSVLLGALLPVTGYWPIAAGGDAGPKAIASWLHEWMPDGDAAALGARYLRAHPAERSADRLAQALFGCAVSDAVDRPGMERLLCRVQASRARDYRSDDLVILDGWAVPRTEAQLLALLACCAGR